MLDLVFGFFDGYGITGVVMLQLLLCFFDDCLVAGLLKNEHQHSLTWFLDFFSIDEQLFLMNNLWNITCVGNIKQGWVPGIFYSSY